MAEIPNGYAFSKDEFPRVLLMKFFPERTDKESVILLAYLASHIQEFDRLTFSRRVGQGLPPDPTHLPGVQANTVFSSKQRIDLLAWSGTQPTIVEVKERVRPSALGQILSYRQLLLEEFPNAPEPRLVVAGLYSDEDTIRVLQAHGVDVYLYPPAETTGLDRQVGVRPDDVPAP